MITTTMVFTRKLSVLFRLQKRCLHEAYINGEWVKAHSGKEFPVRSPYNDSTIDFVPDMSVSDTVLAINSAFDAFQTWKITTAKQRGLLLRTLYNLCCENEEVLAQTIAKESGKPIMEARSEVKYGNSFIDWFAEESRRIDGEIICSPVKSKKIFLVKQPIGPVGIITPWNFPYAMITRKVAAALASGCTCVMKPSEDTPLTALLFAKLSQKCDIPPGVINVITSKTPEDISYMGELMCQSPKMAGIFFTGSTQVGKKLYELCSSSVKRIGLELGGNAPFIVFPSANLDLAVQGAMASKFRNCGQTCVSANRFLIHESIFDQFIDKLHESVRKYLILGDNLLDNVTVGPLINFEQFVRVKNIVDDAVTKGAQIITGGTPAKEFGDLFYYPTILININGSMKCYSEEVFGPIASCIKFSTTDEAIELANCTKSGLASYFYSNDLKEIVRVSEALDVGMVGINEGMISMAEAAFGGVKESGMGREGSHHGIDDYTFVKYVCLGNI